MAKRARKRGRLSPVDRKVERIKRDLRRLQRELEALHPGVASAGVRKQKISAAISILKMVHAPSVLECPVPETEGGGWTLKK